MESQWKNKSVLVTGACGTVGRELVRQLAEHPVSRILGLDNNESEVFFDTEFHRQDPRVRYRVADVRDDAAIRWLMQGVAIAIHVAALKHVILCEQAPDEAIQTNILGTQNMIHAARACGVQRVLFTSSDKAVNPTSVMGTAKLMGEKLFSAANAERGPKQPIFASTRFGNVLGSRGSVIPLFRRQVAAGGPVTLTHQDMTRFIMTLREAVGLVVDSVWLALGGEVFVTKMPVVRIADLAQNMIRQLAPRYGFSPEEIELVVIGPKDGEKMFEELLSGEETRRTIELDRYFVVRPAFCDLVGRQLHETYPGIRALETQAAYVSRAEDAMSAKALHEYLLKNSLYEEEA